MIRTINFKSAVTSGVLFARFLVSFITVFDAFASKEVFEFLAEVLSFAFLSVFLKPKVVIMTNFTFHFLGFLSSEIYRRVLS